MSEKQTQLVFKNYFDYAQAASRTLKSEGERFDTGHMGLGLATEYFELESAIENNDIVNLHEEIGDANWYMANLLKFNFENNHKIWLQLTDIYFVSPQSNLLSLEYELKYVRKKVETISDICKKRFAYDKKIENYKETLAQLNIDLHKAYVSMLLKVNVIPAECLNKNINKLYKRYPEKFDSFLAMNRDLVQEYDALK